MKCLLTLVWIIHDYNRNNIDFHTSIDRNTRKEQNHRLAESEKNKKRSRLLCLRL
jgi:hypothetical protein